PTVDPAIVVARQGSFDLAGRDLSNTEPVSLDGEWAFYYQELLQPADFATSTHARENAWAVVPGYWNGIDVGGKKMPGNGYATYRLVVKHFKASGELGLRVIDAGSAYRIWVNGVYTGSNGRVSADPAHAIPAFLPSVYPLHSSGDSLEIVIQVSNYFHHKGGLWRSIELGNFDAVLAERDRSRTAELLLAGSMFILFVYHIFIFLLRRKEYASFWFALLCLDSTVRSLFTGERIIYSMFPWLSLPIGFRIEYLTITVGVPIYAMVAYQFYTAEWSKTARNIILITGAVESLLVCILPVAVFSRYLPLIQLIVVLECLYLMYSIIRAMSNKSDYAIISFFSYCLLFAAIVHDILAAQLIINSPFVLFYAFTTFLVLQAYILASRNAGAYLAIEELSQDLNQANITLETKVNDRTKQLQLANGQLTEEKRKSDELLRNILPAEIAEELKEKGVIKARRFPSVTIMFTDFKDFTKVSEQLTPEQLVKEIDYCYKRFDELVESYGLEKIKTMGDAYICAGGLPAMNFTHPEDITAAALAIRDFMEEYNRERVALNQPYFDIRIGVHTGSVVAGIVGSRKFAYDIWGDTVNLAARMESSGEAGKVNISGVTYQMIKDKFNCTYRGKIEAKNKGAMDMYFVESKQG
ncbi:MAG TPA: adenylate/guanylate cyclase domain-containing protein, partial [Chitinophagaceae bacterium]|nr:adenylate/guanylate cyclase domain-containing protein [Chitinophagaceae bacterium]